MSVISDKLIANPAIVRRNQLIIPMGNAHNATAHRLGCLLTLTTLDKQIVSLVIARANQLIIMMDNAHNATAPHPGRVSQGILAAQTVKPAIIAHLGTTLDSVHNATAHHPGRASLGILAAQIAKPATIA
ncbi:MAG: hypothetical protein HN929_10205, partial [Chloroflexi bacterium]|nr:hypothetical protein [Chloroflexota bacterium]